MTHAGITAVLSVGISRGLRCVAVGASAGLILTGCGNDNSTSGGPPPGDSSLEWVFADHTGVALDQAQALLGMSTSTYEVYDEARRRGYVMAADLTSVMPDFRDCVAAAGLQVQFDPSRDGLFGLPDVGWGIMAPADRELTDADDTLVTQCANRTVGPLESVYINQPSSPERAEVWSTDGRREAAFACIEPTGHFVRADGSMEEYLEVAKDIATEAGDDTCLDLVLNGPAASPSS